MNRNDVDWRGYWAACPTPFNGEVGIDTVELRALVDWYLDQGLHGLLVNGTSGEWFSQSDEERRLTAETVIDQVGGRIPVVICVTSYTARLAAELGSHAMEAGAAGIAATAPPYSKPLPEETVAFYQDLSDLTGAPILAYNWPHGTSIDIDGDLAEQIVDIDGVVGLKDSTPNAEQFRATTERIVGRARVFGNFMTVDGLDFVQRVGGDGMIGGGCLFGRPDPQFWEDVWSGSIESARLHAVATERLFEALWAPGGWRGWYGGYQSELKAAMRMLGIPGGGAVRRPRLPIEDPDSLVAIRKALTDSGLAVVD